MTLQLAQQDTLAALRVERATLDTRKRAQRTLIDYQCDWRAFSAWCEEFALDALPAASETVSLYVTHRLHGRKISSTRRVCASIGYYHRVAGVPSPAGEARELLKAAQRERGEKPRQMLPLRIEELRQISAKLRDEASAAALLERAVLVLGFSTALRRASLAALELGDVEVMAQGLVVHVTREKQDQLGRGRMIGVPYGSHEDTCAPRCVQAWLASRGTAPGKLFVHPRPRGRRPVTGEWIGNVVRRRAAEIGLGGANYSGHSLRAGFVTAAGEAGLGELLIASQTGHRNMAVLRRYFRRTELFRANAAAMIGL